MTSQSFAHKETPEEKADRLLRLAIKLEMDAMEALEAAEAAFRALEEAEAELDRGR